MRAITVLAAGFAAVLVAASAGPAGAAGMCRTEHLSCATTMPAGGYCECTSRGNVESGEVSVGAAPRSRVSATAGGCGAQPNAPGCR